MILTGVAIRQEFQRGTITLDPFDARHINPNSYNFHLHTSVLFKPKGSTGWQPQQIDASGLLLVPRRLYLAATAEIIGSENFVITLLGKSSVGRLGLFLNITADLGHVGCSSRWTLELTVVQPVRIYAGMCIGQVAFWRTTSAAKHKYIGRYHRHRRPISNRDPTLTNTTK